MDIRLPSLTRVLVAILVVLATGILIGIITAVGIHDAMN